MSDQIQTTCDYNLDISADVCPITFVKTKLLLETMPVGGVANIRLSAGEALDNVPRTLTDYGQEILDLDEIEPGIFMMRVRKDV
ncbi:sulfurtransferase TusA family protein [Marinivivus vitaminiproducens]|uniref:sulfurtransferase TusA family protein n=1 Tax=Marinivivus vitaminiproducens TaxID=3035935 RepID=UPI00279CBD40|nr:sulfurtransferase TusA family protein [Geminicoccaceae bacterium SCSIO 64248]